MGEKGSNLSLLSEETLEDSIEVSHNNDEMQVDERYSSPPRSRPSSTMRIKNRLINIIQVVHSTESSTFTPPIARNIAPFPLVSPMVP